MRFEPDRYTKLVFCHLNENVYLPWSHFVIEEGIDDESFPLLDDETIGKIIVKAGPRLLFKKHFKASLKEIESPSSPCSLVSTLTEPITSSPSTITPSTSYVYEPDDELRNFMFDTSEVEMSRNGSGEKREAEELQERGLKKLKTSESIIPQGMVALLDKYTDGKIVLLNKKKLNNDHRQKLCKVLVNEMISLFGSELRAHHFMKICEEIERTFDNEIAETYYIPYSPGGEKSKRGSGPKGKLWCRYVNVRAALRLANAHKTPPVTEKRNSPEENIEIVKSLDFLKVGVEPYTKVLSAWEDTFKLRRKLYLNSELYKIFTDFPCLKMNWGIELIESDFNKRYTEKIDKIYSEWPRVADAILKEAVERKIKFDSMKDRSTEAIMILPYLFSPITLKKNRKGITWKPTRSEVQESFFLTVMNYDELEERIDARKNKLRSYGMTLQPFGVLVHGVETFYIVIDDVKYKLDSAIRTLELLFKFFHALDVEYPSECEHVWLFIQEFVFSMKSSRKCSSTVTLMSDLSYHLNVK